jgi:hypothetical protein
VMERRTSTSRLCDRSSAARARAVSAWLRRSCRRMSIDRPPELTSKAAFSKGQAEKISQRTSSV